MKQFAVRQAAQGYRGCRHVQPSVLGRVATTRNRKRLAMKQLYLFLAHRAPRTTIPRIPIRWGMKIWSLIDSRSGYVYNWNINRGKKDGLRTQNNDGKETVHWTTWDLLESANMLDKSYHLFFFLKLYLKMWPQGIQELAIHCE